MVIHIACHTGGTCPRPTERASYIHPGTASIAAYALIVRIHREQSRTEETVDRHNDEAEATENEIIGAAPPEGNGVERVKRD